MKDKIKVGDRVLFITKDCETAGTVFRFVKNSEYVWVKYVSDENGLTHHITVHIERLTKVTS